MAVSKKSDHYIPALTGLRAVAAYLVFLHHYNPAAPGTLAWQVFDQGYTGVSVFFVLSGFLIYHRYANTYFDRTEWSWWRYLQNRFARIYPLYAVLLLVTAGVAVGRGHPMKPAVFGLNLTLLKGFFDAYKFSGVPQSWSLTVEGCFYLLAPFLFRALKRFGAFWLTATLVGTGLFLWLIGKQLAWDGLFYPLPFVFFYTFSGRAFEFIVGMWLANRWHQGHLPTVPYSAVAGFFIMLVCVGWQACLPIYTTNSTLLMGSEAVAYNFVLPIAIGFLFLNLLIQPSVINWVFSHPVMQALGGSSYAFYLIHVGVIASGLQRAGITNYGFLFFLLVALSHALYWLIEKPLHRLITTTSTGISLR